MGMSDTKVGRQIRRGKLNIDHVKPNCAGHVCMSRATSKVRCPGVLLSPQFISRLRTEQQSAKDGELSPRVRVVEETPDSGGKRGKKLRRNIHRQ